MDLPTFAGIWTLMMAAMMLPSIALVAALYALSIVSHRVVRPTSLSIGYLVTLSIPAPFVYALAALQSAAAASRSAPRRVLHRLCWGLMLVLVMIGSTMNIVIMTLIAGAILLEKYLPCPIWSSRAVGLAISAVGFASLWIPQMTTGTQ